MIKMMLFMFMLMMEYGCATIDEPNKQSITSGVHPEFVPYLEDYKNLINPTLYEKMRIYRISINFDPELTKSEDTLNGIVVTETSGVCNYLFNKRWITINPDFWKRASIERRMALMYHELEHCIRDRDHSGPYEMVTSFKHLIDNLKIKMGIIELTSPIQDGCPGDIMDPYVVSEYCIEKHFNYYLWEIITWRSRQRKGFK